MQINGRWFTEPELRSYLAFLEAKVEKLESEAEEYKEKIAELEGKLIDYKGIVGDLDTLKGNATT